MPNCLADLWMLLRDASLPAAGRLAAALRMDTILGLDLASAAKPEVQLDEESSRLLAQRETARKARDFSKADEIRAAAARPGDRGPGRAQGAEATFRLRSHRPDCRDAESWQSPVSSKRCNVRRIVLLAMGSTEYARPPSFDDVYERLFPTIFHVAYRITGSREIAEDLCQEAFIKLMERPNLLPDLDQSKYWLLRVVRNLSLNSEKRRRRERAAVGRLTQMSAGVAESGEKQLLQSELRSSVQAALDRPAAQPPRTAGLPRVRQPRLQGNRCDPRHQRE